MKLKTIMTVFVSGLSLSLAACGLTNQSLQEQNNIAEQLNPNRELRAPTDDELQHKLGYVRYSADEINVQTIENQNLTIDRSQMADIITRIILKTDGFKEVATLVTDQEVLIAYERNEEMPANDASNIAKKTAVSVMPGFYDVYVSDNKSLMHDIHSLHNSTTDRNYDNTINKIKQEMRKTPQ